MFYKTLFFVYNMPVLLSPDVMRLFLFACLLGMAILAILFLRERKLSLSAYLIWGLLVALLPLVGPFLVIMISPGGQGRPKPI